MFIFLIVAFPPFKVDEISTRNFWGLSGKKAYLSKHGMFLKNVFEKWVVFKSQLIELKT